MTYYIHGNAVCQIKLTFISDYNILIYECTKTCLSKGK